MLKPLVWTANSKKDFLEFPKEVVESHYGDTYRAVYTVRLEGAVYVLHCFQKKSTSGVATPKQDIELVKSRLRLAEEDDKRWIKKQKNP